MNPEPESQTPELPPADAVETPICSSDSDIRQSPIPVQQSPPKRRRRTGKVASLPDETRKQINGMLQNGFSYRRIIEKLHEPGALPLPYEITENNISEWKDGGHEDWLKDQFWQEEMRTRHQAFSGLLANGADAIQLPEGGLQLAAIGLCELLRDVSEASETSMASSASSPWMEPALKKVRTRSTASLIAPETKTAGKQRMGSPRNASLPPNLTELTN